MSESPVVIVPLASAAGEFRPLSKTLRKDGFDLVQLKREKDVAVYKQSKPGQADLFETIIIRGRQAYTIGSNYLEAAEVYPSPESWGVYGWTYKDLSSAIMKMRNLLRVRK